MLTNQRTPEYVTYRIHDSRIRFVGCTRKPLKTRLQEHFREKSRFGDWLRDQDPTRIEITVIDTFSDLKSALEAQLSLIQVLRAAGSNLMNPGPTQLQAEVRRRLSVGLAQTVRGEETRARVAAFLETPENQTLTDAEIGERLDMSRSQVQAHLRILVASGILRSQVQRIKGFNGNIVVSRVLAPVETSGAIPKNQVSGKTDAGPR